VLCLFTDTNPFAVLRQCLRRSTGVGISGGVGYILPPGSFALGRNARIEAEAQYVSARSTDTAGGPVLVNVGAQLANGQLAGGVGCAASVPPCATAGTLTSDYSAWRFGLRGGSGFMFGPLTLTPSIGLFGGTARTDQDFRQTLFTAIVQLGSYAASSGLDWTDFGVKAGLRARFDVTNTISVGASGSIAAAQRDVSLSIADSYVTGAGTFVSTVRVGDSASPVLTNAEVSADWRPMPLWTGRAFVG